MFDQAPVLPLILDFLKDFELEAKWYLHEVEVHVPKLQHGL